MASNVTFSAIIPAYNSADTINRAIDSILAQSYSVLEIIVVDDGSNDRTPEIVKEYGEPVRYVHQHNQGPSGARNHGIQEAIGDWVAFLDADDVWYPKKLKRQAELIELGPELGVVFCNWYNKKENGDIVSDGFSDPYELLNPQKLKKKILAPGLYVLKEDPFAVLLETFILHTNTAVVRKTILQKIHYDTKYCWGEDWLFYLDISRFAKFGFVDEVLAEYKERSDSICKTASLKTMKSRYEVAKEPMNRYGIMPKNLKKLLYPRIYKSSMIFGYKLIDQRKDIHGARAVWRKAAMLKPGFPALKLLLLSLTPILLLYFSRTLKRVLNNSNRKYTSFFI